MKRLDRKPPRILENTPHVGTKQKKKKHNVQQTMMPTQTLRQQTRCIPHYLQMWNTSAIYLLSRHPYICSSDVLSHCIPLHAKA